jgi:hypothetical protein
MVGMLMKTYARIQDGSVAELLTTSGNIADMFNPGLIWVDVSAHPKVAGGWQFDGTNFTPPASPPPGTTVPTIAQLQAQLAAISAELAAISSRN